MTTVVRVASGLKENKALRVIVPRS